MLHLVEDMNQPLCSEPETFWNIGCKIKKIDKATEDCDHKSPAQRGGSSNDRVWIDLFMQCMQLYIYGTVRAIDFKAVHCKIHISPHCLICTHKLYMRLNHHGSIFPYLVCEQHWEEIIFHRGRANEHSRTRNYHFRMQGLNKVTRGTGKPTELKAGCSGIFARIMFRACTAGSWRKFRCLKERAADWLRKADRRRFTCRPGRGFAPQTT